MPELRAVVRGRVQLVMFRDFVQRKASRLGLVGFVHNLRDGSVEVVAQGEKRVLEALIEKIRAGSILSRVDEVAVEWREASEQHQGFRIIYH